MIDATTASTLFSAAIGGVIGGVLVLWCIYKPDQGNLLDGKDLVTRFDEIEKWQEDIEILANHIHDIENDEVIDEKARRELREMRILLNQLPEVKKLVK